MFFHTKRLINDIPSSDPDPAAANALQEGLGGQFGEMRTMMQYLFQSFNSRGDALHFKDLIQAVGIEEISHMDSSRPPLRNYSTARQALHSMARTELSRVRVASA